MGFFGLNAAGHHRFDHQFVQEYQQHLLLH
jgi:hypothetical protein